jgi:polysaccharide export outer membrane protein
LCLLVALSGCAGSGPFGLAVRGGQQDPEGLPYAFVRITPKVTKLLAKEVPRLAGAFRDRRRPSDIRFGVGDILSVTIFEASSGGLFIPSEAGVRPGNFITIPNQAVDSNGNISIPYAGTVRALGRTRVELQDAVVAALRNRAIEPQVVVTVVSQQTSLITVLGDVKSTGRLPAMASGERLLDTLTRAGGPASPGPDAWVMLERQGRRALAPFGALIYEPANNIFAHPDDVIYVYTEPQTFLTFGALGTQQQVPFGAWRISLAEAVAKAGGLSDGQADPKSVFLYRGETRRVAEALGVDTSKFQGPVIPIIYNLNLRDPAGFFLATNLEMRNKDVIYVSNAVAVETAKFASYVSAVTGTINDPVSTATGIYGLRNIIRGTGQVPSIISPTTTTINTVPAP